LLLFFDFGAFFFIEAFCLTQGFHDINLTWFLQGFWIKPSLAPHGLVAIKRLYQRSRMAACSLTQLPVLHDEFMKKIPLHILTGFLGSGKTTAVLHLLREVFVGERVIVIVNEFGEIDIDGATLSSSSQGENKRNLYRLHGGCVCCSSGIELQKKIQEIALRDDFDRLIIEPSGLARPADILDLVRQSDAKGRFEIKSVVALANPISAGRFDVVRDPLILQQLETADIIVANFADVATAQDFERFEEKLLDLYPPRPKPMRIAHGKLSLEMMESPRAVVSGGFPIGGAFRLSEPSQSSISLQAQKPLSSKGYQGAGRIWGLDKVFNLDELEQALLMIDDIAGADVVRFKGVFQTDIGWLLAEMLVSGEEDSHRRFQCRESYYRADSRAEIIVRGEGLDLERVWTYFEEQILLKK
jgi:G3E family GTPase